MEERDAVPILFGVEAMCQPMKRVPPKISMRIEKNLVQLGLSTIS